jgi:hypothetical protein
LRDEGREYQKFLARDKKENYQKATIGNFFSPNMAEQRIDQAYLRGCITLGATFEAE